MRTSFGVGQDPARAVDDRRVDHLSVEGDRAAPLALAALGRRQDALGPGDALVLRPEDAVDDRDLRRVDAGLAAKAQRPREAGRRLEPRVVACVEVDDVDGAADSGGGRVGTTFERA
jgi:hypothetical protein